MYRIMIISENQGGYQIDSNLITQEILSYSTDVVNTVDIKGYDFDYEAVEDGFNTTLKAVIEINGLTLYVAIQSDFINSQFSYGLVSGDFNYLAFNETVLNTERDTSIIINNKVYNDAVKGLVNKIPNEARSLVDSNDEVSVLITLMALGIYKDCLLDSLNTDGKALLNPFLKVISENQKEEV